MTRLTPLEIQRTSFATHWRGYAPDAVREFLGAIAEQVEEDARQRGELRGQIARLTKDMEEHRARADALNQALLAAEHTAETTVGCAEAEAQRIVAQAHALADRILEEAARRTQNIEVMITQLRSRRRAARADLRRLAELLTGAAREDEAAEHRENEDSTVTMLRPRQREKVEP